MNAKPTYEELQQRVKELESSEVLLSDANSRFRHLIDNLPALVSYADQQHHYQLNNKAYEKWFGLNRNEIIGRHVKDVLGEEIYFEIKPNLEKALSGNKVSFEIAIHPKDGEKRSLLANYIPDFDNTGNVVGLFALVNDITEIKQAQQGLRESEEKFRQLAENIQEVFWLTSTDDFEQVEYVSPNYEKVWGLSAQALYEDSRIWLQPIHQDDKLKVTNAFTEFLKGENDFAVEYRLLCPDGTERWIMDHGFHIKDSQGEIVRVAGIARDITKQKKMVENLDERNIQLASANAALQALLQQRDNDRKNFEEKVIFLHQSLVQPIINKLKSTRSLETKNSLLELLESNLAEISKPFLNKFSALKFLFTPMEIQVANMIHYGMSTKDIAGTLNLSPGTISESHHNK
jgi:PAS domain S-box-containing protein